MALFTGTYADNKIDRKGRVSLPAKFRAEFPPENNREIYIYPSPTMDALEACDRTFMEQIRDTAGNNPFEDEDADLGWLIEQAHNITVDTGGRIMLPPELADHAGIRESLVFVGRGHRFLIMSPDIHAAYRERSLKRQKSRARKRMDGEE
jgi:MraZ protein